MCISIGVILELVIKISFLREGVHKFLWFQYWSQISSTPKKSMSYLLAVKTWHYITVSHCGKLLATKQNPSHQSGSKFLKRTDITNSGSSLQADQMLYPIPDISHNLLYDDSIKNKKTALGSVNVYVKDVDELSMKVPTTLLIRSVERKVGAIL